MQPGEPTFDSDILPTVDERTRNDIIRRRKLDYERRRRIFDPKQRQLGVDVNALDQQVMERRAQQEKEQQDKQVYDLYQEGIMQAVENYDRANQNEYRRVLIEDNKFRMENQKYENRREFHLNNPNALREEAPIRDTTQKYDPRLGVSSGQQFEGEDHDAPLRMKRQQQEAREAYVAQMTEKQQNAFAEKTQRLTYEQQQLQLFDRIEALKADIARQEREQKVETAQMNLQLAEQRRQLEKLQKESDDMAEQQEINYTLSSNLMTENREQTLSFAAPGTRYRPDHFKYYPQEFNDEVRATQLRQAEEKKERERREAEDARKNALILEDIMRKTDLYAQREQNERREVARGIADTLRLQDNEHKSKESIRNQRGEIDTSYFEKFGSSSR